MKRIVTSLLTLCAMNFYSQAQITITRADMPCPTAANCGLDSVILTTVPPVQNVVDVNTTGANSIWNVVPLTNGTTSYQKFYPLNMTPIEFQIAFFGTDYAQPLLGSQNIAGFPLTDAYEYYNYANNNSRLEIKGFGAHLDLQGIPTPLAGLYTSPDVLYRFPLNYGDMDSSNSGYSVDVPPVSPFATITRQQKRVNQVDGWGSMTTPAGTFDVLRVTSEITRIDSVITQILSFGAPSNIIEYKWLGAAKKIPVLQVTGNVIAANYTATNISFWGFDPLGIAPEYSFNPQLNIYPNPSSANTSVQFTLNKESDIDIELYSVTGSRIAHFHFQKMKRGSHEELLPTAQLASGTYFVRCSNKDGKIVNKLIKN